VLDGLGSAAAPAGSAAEIAGARLSLPALKHVPQKRPTACCGVTHEQSRRLRIEVSDDPVLVDAYTPSTMR